MTGTKCCLQDTALLLGPERPPGSGPGPPSSPCVLSIGITAGEGPPGGPSLKCTSMPPPCSCSRLQGSWRNLSSALLLHPRRLRTRVHHKTQFGTGHSLSPCTRGSETHTSSSFQGTGGLLIHNRTNQRQADIGRPKSQVEGAASAVAQLLEAWEHLLFPAVKLCVSRGFSRIKIESLKHEPILKN